MLSRKVAIVDADQGRAKNLAGVFHFGNYEAHVRTPEHFLENYSSLGVLCAVLVGDLSDAQLESLLLTRDTAFPETPLMTFIPSNHFKLVNDFMEVDYPLDPRQFSNHMLTKLSNVNRRTDNQSLNSYNKLQDQIHLVAECTSPAMIFGDSARGRGLVARAIHDQSGQKDGPFLELSGHMESATFRRTLSGHEHAPGALELCTGGTLFVDHIGWIDKSSQIALMRMLTERHGRRLGSDSDYPTSLRLLTASDNDLRPQVLEKVFRADLWHRLNLMSVKMPCLRKRFSDLPDLLSLLFREYRPSEAQSRDPCRLMDAIQRYGWPRNIHELAETVEWLTLLSLDPNWVMPCAQAKDLTSFLACLELLPADAIFQKAKIAGSASSDPLSDFKR